MNLEQNVRSLHLIVIAAIVGFISGGMILAVGLTTSRTGNGANRAAPTALGAALS